MQVGVKSIYAGPMADVHIHVMRRGPEHSPPGIDEILGVIRRSGIEFAVVMPTPNDGRWSTHEEGVRLRNELAEASRGIVAQFCGSNYLTYWMHRAYHEGYTGRGLDAILKRLADDMSCGKYAGVGEIGLYHFKKRPGQNIIMYPPSFEPFLEMVRLVVSQKMWLTLHAEPVDEDGRSYEKEIFGGLELMYRHNPDLKIILAHTGMTTARKARELLKKYPGMMMDVVMENEMGGSQERKCKNPVVAINADGERYDWEYQKAHSARKNLKKAVNSRGKLYEDWSQLFTEIPERFLVGTDARFGHPGWDVKIYFGLIRRVRRILGALDAKAAQLIAYENAQKIFKHP